VLPNRRYLTCCATVLALLIGSSSAVAKTHAAHTARISGVVVSIDAKRHTLKLHLKHVKLPRVATAASAGGSSTILVAFDHATVKGPNGAVAIGEDVSVTTTGPVVGATAVASSIDVVGQSNGGDSGKGAAVPGQVTAVDPTNGTLTLAVTSTDSQGKSQDSSVIVTLGASTILAVGDTNGDGHATLADVVVGDHVVVFTADATANPIAAIGILDASHTGGDHQGGDGSHGELTKIPGSVTGVDMAGSNLTLSVSDGTLAGHTITVHLGDHTSFGGQDSGHHGPIGLGDVAAGDSVVVYTRDATTTPIVAVGVVDESKSSGNSSTSPSSTSTVGQTQRFGGIVTDVRGDGLTVNVTSGGPLSGQTVVVSVPPTTSLDGATGAGGGPESLSNVAVGDGVEVYTHSESTSPIIAVGVRDDGRPSDGSTSPTPPSGAVLPQRFGGVVTGVSTGGLTVNVLSGGPLSGQTVTVSVPSTASFKGPGGGPETLANIAVGDAVEVYTPSESASPIVAVGVVDDGVWSGS
jgi:hypothetical protein